MAQTSGLPEYGVLLGGTADAPDLHNNSPKRILVSALRYDNAQSVTGVNFLFQRSWPPPNDIGIAPGAIYSLPRGFLDSIGGGGGGRSPSAPSSMPKISPLLPRTSVTLDAVLFEDGHLVGPDKGGMFQRLTEQIKAEQEVAAILLNATDTDRGAAWQKILRIARSGGFEGDGSSLAAYRLSYAQQLIQIVATQGEAAALKLAESTKNYPTIVKER